MHINITLTGTTPLLMHNERLSDSLDPIVKAIKEITSKRTNQTDDDKAQIAKLEWRGSLYLDKEDKDDGKIIINTRAIIKSLVNAAVVTRSGKKISRGLNTLTLHVPLLVENGKWPTRKELWDTRDDDGKCIYADRRQVGIGRNRISRTRPIFHNWSLSADFQMLEDVLNFDDLINIAELAGRAEGLGDARVIGFGRFTVKITKIK